MAFVAESFLPRVNGVTNSVCRAVEHLVSRGHEALVIAPSPAPVSYAGARVVAVPAVSVPGCPEMRAGAVTARRVERILAPFRPDLVHLASPTLLGASGARAAQRLGIPIVAVFQTDLAAFATHYRAWSFIRSDTIWRWLLRVHERADRTLAPSSATIQELAARGFPRLARWGRGVDLERFNPSRRDPLLRATLAPHGEVLVGYVGRLAPEKEVQRLVALHGMPGVRLVVVGAGNAERVLRRAMPDAAFLGFRTGSELGAAVASLDVFVHPGSSETFCQAVQEALASGVPVVAPAAGGPVDLVQHGRTGLLFTPGDNSDMRHRVARLAYDPVLRGRLGGSARGSVLGRSWDALGDELLGHYGEVLDARGGLLTTSA